MGRVSTSRSRHDTKRSGDADTTAIGLPCTDSRNRLV